MDYPLPDSEMPAKGNETSPWIVLFCLVAFMLIGLVIGSLVTTGLITSLGFEGLSFLSTLKEEASLQQRNLARWANLFPHLFAFTGGALLVALLFFRSKWLQELKLNHWPGWLFIGASLLFIVGIFPFAQTTYWINQQLPLQRARKTAAHNAPIPRRKARRIRVRTPSTRGPGTAPE